LPPETPMQTLSPSSSYDTARPARRMLPNTRFMSDIIWVFCWKTQAFSRLFLKCPRELRHAKRAAFAALSLSKKSLELLRAAALNLFLPAAPVDPAQRIAQFGRFPCALCRS
jgi:hypothetical protein